MKIYETETALKKKASELSASNAGLQSDIQHNKENKEKNDQTIHDLQEQCQRLQDLLDEQKQRNDNAKVHEKVLLTQIENYNKQIAAAQRIAYEKYQPHIQQLEGEIKELEVCLYSLTSDIISLFVFRGTSPKTVRIS